MMQHRGALPIISGGRKIRWLFRNEMNSLTGEVGTWAERDVEDKIAFTSGWAEFTPQASPVYAEQDLACSAPAITRAAGVALLSKFRCTTDGSFYPLALVTSATPTWNATHVEAAFHRAATALSLTATYNATAGPIIATFVADGTLYKLALILEAAGQKYYIKGGAFTNWALLYRSVTGATAALYAAMAGYSAAFGADFIRGPVSVIASNPLLSDTFSGTFGTPDVIGGTWLHAGTWATTAGVVSCTPVAGVQLNSDSGFDAAGDWTKSDANWVVGSSVVTGTIAGGIVYQAVGILGRWYKAKFDIKTSTAGTVKAHFGSGGGWGGPEYSLVANNYIITGRAQGTSPANLGLWGVFFSGTVDNYTAQNLPISTLITNQLLTTTDVLAEEVISAYSLGSQAGIVQSDRPFAFPANADAAAGQPVIVLKDLTNAVPDTDTITIKHPITPTTYTIASVSALVAGVQTITLDTNLVEDVAADSMVGVDWASWNGTVCYFDGAGNIKLDEVALGIYTNRGSTAKEFSAAARFIVRKIGSEYRWFYGEALITTTSAVAAGAMTGMYWGMFLTLAANTITSYVVYDTGNVTNCHAILDKYSRD